MYVGISEEDKVLLCIKKSLKFTLAINIILFFIDDNVET